MSLGPFNDNNSFDGPIQDDICGDRDVFGMNDCSRDCDYFDDDRFHRRYGRYGDDSFRDRLWGRNYFSFRFFGFRFFYYRGSGEWEVEVSWHDVVLSCVVLGIIVLSRFC